MADNEQDRETLIVLTSDIVAAHVSNNNVGVEEVSSLIANVYAALSGLSTEPAVEAAAKEPAVPIRASVRPDHVTCLECGKKMTMLKRHLSTDHNLTVNEYRQRWGLSSNHPVVAPNYAARRADLAKKIGLGRKPGEETKAKARKSGASSPTPVPADTKSAKRQGLIRKLNKNAEKAPAQSD